ncbi:MAG: glucose-6-phosphate isomerase [Faecalibacterium sp.]
MVLFDFDAAQDAISRQEYEAFYAEQQPLITQALCGALPYADSMGWYCVDRWANDGMLDALLAKAAEIKENATAFVLVGVGGSNQAARAAIRAIGEKSGIEIIDAGNTLSAFELHHVAQRLAGKDFYINVIAKNFETLEPGASFRFLRKLLHDKYGCDAHRHIIATGSKGSHFEAISAKEGYAFFTFPDCIGGRYSVFSDVGLLPMAVAGLDIKAMVAGAKKMEQILTSEQSIENPAVKYALIRALLHRKGFRMEMLSFFEPRLRYFSKWWTQLFAESEGKDGKGCYPIVGEYSEDLHSIGQFVQEGTPIIFETFLCVSERDVLFSPQADAVDDRFDYLNDKDFWQINKAAEAGTIAVHASRLPCIILTIPQIDEEHLGMLYYFYMLMCSLSASLLSIHPFNQDGVEAYKSSMFRILKK